ncbi:hypothetical protein QMK17_24520 [Rhodococcus sp. G-MC3]|uniref:hypothetical protein n=1 Tax=Rhodococcus sp. G-MC3 TaxID=3046209 RepID=UPI0024B8A01B|nr:hypothetical protein [Rhodococcus sp. G-MC3]MDJ0396472.1 hypothetical protein [Rhodococcus sp. G-MC3]
MTTTPHITDAEIKSRVQLELRWAPNLNTTQVGLAVTDGSVTLSGDSSETRSRTRWPLSSV